MKYVIKYGKGFLESESIKVESFNEAWKYARSKYKKFSIESV
jgi:hypothetical protein